MPALAHPRAHTVFFAKNGKSIAEPVRRKAINGLVIQKTRR